MATTNYNIADITRLPDNSTRYQQDSEIIDTVNANNVIVDTALQGLETNKLSKTSDIKDTTVAFTEATERENILTTDKMSTLLGKIKKWFTDLKTIAFSGHAKDATITDTNSKYTSENVDGALDEIGLQMEQKADKDRLQFKADNYKLASDLPSIYDLGITEFFTTSADWMTLTGLTNYIIVKTEKRSEIFIKQEFFSANGQLLKYRLGKDGQNAWGEIQTISTTDKIDILSTDLLNGWAIFGSHVLKKSGNIRTIELDMRNGTYTAETIVLSISNAEFKPSTAVFINGVGYNGTIGEPILFELLANGDLRYKYPNKTYSYIRISDSY